MSQWNDEQIREALKAALPPVADVEPRRDLWPQMLRRMDAPAPGIPWLDWAVAAVSALLLLSLPGAAQIVLYFL